MRHRNELTESQIQAAFRSHGRDQLQTVTLLLTLPTPKEMRRLEAGSKAGLQKQAVEDLRVASAAI